MLFTSIPSVILSGFSVWGKDKIGSPDSTQAYTKFELALIFLCCDKMHTSSLFLLHSCGKIDYVKHAVLTLNFVYR